MFLRLLPLEQKLRGLRADVFSYSALFVEDSHDSLWLLTFYERLHFKALLEIAGTADDLPPDLSVNHDHYLYGVPNQA